MEFSWKKGLLYGALVWVIVFAVVSALVGFKFYDNMWAKGLIIVICAILAVSFARKTKPDDFITGFYYGLTWVVIALLLDYLVSYRFNHALFYTKSLWVSYAAILLGAMFGGPGNKQQESVNNIQKL